MATSCFCGCGREIKGVRARANNTVAGQVDQDLTTLRGALDYGEAGTHTEAAATVIGEGETMLDQLTVFLHGGDRTVDKSALQSWLGTAKDLRGEIVNAMTNPWLPDEPNTDLVANSGVRSRGVVTEVRRVGGGNEFVATVDLTVEVQDDAGGPVPLQRKASFSVIKTPRVGDDVEVSYQPTDLGKFVVRPHIDR